VPGGGRVDPERWVTASYPHEPFPDDTRAANSGPSYESTISLARRFAGINDLKFCLRSGPGADPWDGDQRRA
jgi:hypothetical protein